MTEPPRTETPPPGGLAADRLAALAAAAVILLSVVIASWVASRSGSREVGSATVQGATVPSVEVSSLPLARDPRALMLAKRAGDVLVGAAALPGGPVDLTVITSEAKRLPAAALEARVGSSSGRLVRSTSCGPGCARIEAPVLTGSPLSLVITIARPEKPAARVTFDFPARLPPSGQELMRSVGEAMGSLRAVRVDETLTSGTGFTLRTRYELEAPDRIRFETSQGQRTVLIGRRRWDWEDGHWVASPFPGVSALSYLWDEATHARLLGKSTLTGGPVSVLSLFRADPSFPAWFQLFVAPDGRVLEAEMLAPSHFMVHRFNRFNEPVSIEPPAP